MVTDEIILKVLYQLNKHKANTSLAMIGCILKGDTNSICSDFKEFLEFGSMDDKSMKNMGLIFDELIDKKMIDVVTKGLNKRYEVSKIGLELINGNKSTNNKNKYFSSVGSASDYQEERDKLSDTLKAIDNEIYNIKENKYYKGIGPHTTGIDYDDAEDIKSKKIINESYDREIEKLSIQKIQPYFARMDLLNYESGIDVSSMYFGKKPLSIGNNNLVIDWRAPIASFYYDNLYNFEYNEKKYELQLKRKIDIENSQIKSIYNELSKKKAELKDMISDPFLKNVLKKKKDSLYFTDIIASIQERQNEIIRLPFNTDIIVQGCAGSGKTMILLHRLSYILYNNKKLKLDEIKIVTPSELFDTFVNDLSVELGLEKIDKFSMIDLYVTHIKKYFPTNKSVNYKNENSLNENVIKEIYSQEFLDILISKIKEKMDKDLLDLKNKVFNRIEKKHYNYLKIKEDLNKLIEIKFNNEIVKVKEMLDSEDELLKLLNYDNILKFQDSLSAIIRINENAKEQLNELNRLIEQNKQKIANIDEILNEQFINIIINKANSYRIKLFSNDKVPTSEYIVNYKNELKNFAKTNLELLYNQVTKIESSRIDNKLVKKYKAINDFLKTNIIPLYEEIQNKQYELISFNNNEHDVYEKEIDSANNQISLIKKYLDVFGTNKMFIDEIVHNFEIKIDKSFDMYQYFTDLVIDEVEMIYEKNQSKGRFHNQFKYYYYLQLAILNHFGYKFDSLSLVMIDEAQEFSLNEINLIKKLHPNAFVNLYGDIKQLTSTVGIDDWKQISNDYKYYELNQNYRNPKPIVQFINSELKMNMVPLGLDQGEISLNTTFEKYNINAVIFFSEDKEVFMTESGITEEQITLDKIMHIDQVKGLEFNNVLVHTKNMSKNQKYIAYSRALENLIILE